MPSDLDHLPRRFGAWGPAIWRQQINNSILRAIAIAEVVPSNQRGHSAPRAPAPRRTLNPFPARNGAFDDGGVGRGRTTHFLFFFAQMAATLRALPTVKPRERGESANFSFPDRAAALLFFRFRTFRRPGRYGARPSDPRRIFLVRATKDSSTSFAPVLHYLPADLSIGPGRRCSRPAQAWDKNCRNPFHPPPPLFHRNFPVVHLESANQPNRHEPTIMISSVG